MNNSNDVSLKWNIYSLIASILATGIVSVWLGQDSNWDLWNYHFYNPWAFVHGRMAVDIAAAQLQTYFNPLADLPFYAMVAADFPPQLVSFVLAIPVGVSAWLLGKILFVLFRDVPDSQKIEVIVLSWIIGVSASHAVSAIGTTTNDWMAIPLMLGALWIVLRDVAASQLSRRALLFSGLLMGFAVGMKLSNAHFAVGLSVAILLRRKISVPTLRESFEFSAYLFVGFLMAAGYWMLILWNNFGSPLFPFFNNYIHSPWWIDHPGSFRVYGPKTKLEWLWFPFRYFRLEAGFLSENFFRDWRIPLVYSLGIVLFIRWCWMTIRFRFLGGKVAAGSEARENWRLLIVFCIVSFLIWTAQHSIQRYIILLEILSGALMIGAVRVLFPGRMLVPIISVLAIAATFPTSYPNFGRIAYKERWFDVKLPTVEANALILLVSQDPMSFTFPYFPKDARFVGIETTMTDRRFGQELERSKIYKKMQQVVSEHQGPLYLLTHPKGKGHDALVPYGLQVVAGSCREFETNMVTSPFELCKVGRRPAQ